MNQFESGKRRMEERKQEEIPKGVEREVVA